MIPATAFLHLQLPQGETAETSLIVTASNASVEISQRVNSVDIQDPHPGEVLLSARKTAVISDNAYEDAIFSFNCSTTAVEIKSGHSKFELDALAPEQFPHMEANSSEWADLSMRSSDLRYLITQTEYAMSKTSDPRDYLKGILLSVEGENMVAVATDGHRLAQCSIKHQGESPAGRRAVLPAPAIKEIKGMASPDGDEMISMRVDEKLIVAETANIKIMAKVYEEKRYPDYNRVMPSDFAYTVAVDSEELRRALATMKVVDNALAVIEMEKGTLRIKSKSEQEKVQIEQETDYAGEKFRVGVNHEYLAQVFGVIDSKEAIFQFKDANSAMLITEKDGCNARHVVMPLRM